MRAQRPEALIPIVCPLQKLPHPFLGPCCVLQDCQGNMVLVATEMCGCVVWGGSGYGGPFLTPSSLYSSVVALGRDPALRECAPESCVPRTMVQLTVALTAGEPWPEPEEPSTWQGR